MAVVLIDWHMTTYTGADGIKHADSEIVCLEASGGRETPSAGFCVYMKRPNGERYWLDTSGNLDGAIKLRDALIDLRRAKLATAAALRIDTNAV